MKRIGLIIASCVVASAAFAELVTHDFESSATGPGLPGWQATQTWDGFSVAAGTGEGGTQGASKHSGVQWYGATYTTGVAAPVNVGDYVTYSMRAQIGIDTNSITANKFAFNTKISADTAGAEGAGMVFSRRDNGNFSGATSGMLWSWIGWQNNSAINLTSGGTSDWFTQRVTITKAATNYDILLECLDTDDATVLYSYTSNEAIAGLAASSTWYASFHVEGANDADVSDLYFDNMSLESVPEPATMSFMAVISGAIFFIRRRFI